MENKLKEKYSSIDSWILAVRRTGSNSDSTEDTYLSAFGLFLEATKINPDEIVHRWNNAKVYIDDNKVIHNQKEEIARELEAKIRNYLFSLNPEELTCTYRGKLGDTIRSFLKHHNIQGINVPELSDSDGCPEYIENPLTLGDIQKIIDNSGIREKAYNKFLESSGLRPVTLRKLKIRDIDSRPKELETNIKVTFSEWLENPNDVQCVLVQCPKKVTKGKKVDHHTWIDRETLEYLKTYLEARKIGTRKIQPEELTEESYLFVQNKSPPTLVSKQSMSNIFSDTARQLGVKEGKFDVHIYMLKDYFEKQCGKGVDDLRYIDYWEGHVSYGRKVYFRSYFNPTVIESREQYLKCIDYLKIKGIAEESKTIEGLKKDKEKSDEQFLLLARMMVGYLERQGETESEEYKTLKRILEK